MAASTSPLPSSSITNPHRDSATLVETLRALHHCTRPLHEPEIRALLLQLSMFKTELSAFERFEPDSYCRNRVFSNAFIDLLLLCWRPGQRTPIHDHSRSTCGVYVIRGEAIEIGFAPSDMGPIIPTGSHKVSSGEITVSAEDDMHLVANYSSTGEDLVTLHCYSPPLESMRVFGEEETFFSRYSSVADKAKSSGCYHIKL